MVEKAQEVGGKTRRLTRYQKLDLIVSALIPLAILGGTYWISHQETASDRLQRNATLLSDDNIATAATMLVARITVRCDGSNEGTASRRTDTR